MLAPPDGLGYIRLTSLTPNWGNNSMLDPTHVLAPFRELLGKCQSNVLLGLRLVERIEQFPGPTAEESEFINRFSLIGPAVDIIQGKRDFKAWVLRNGFEEVHSSVRLTLDRLFVYKKVEDAIRANPSQDISRLEKHFEGQASECDFPQILSNADSLLATRLSLKPHIATLNKGRNCLVHSHGIVTSKCCNNHKKDRLLLKLRKLKIFYFKDGVQTIINSKNHPGVENAPISVGAEDYSIEFPLRAAIDLSLQQFIDVLTTCFFFGAEIETHLNVPRPIFQLNMRIYYQIRRVES
jgi:hypothetical protein